MANKITVKQEAFAKAYIETGNASEAYRRSYDCKPDSKPEAIWVRACELLKNSKVAVRVSQLQQEHAKRHEVTVDSITDMLKEDRLQAKGLEQTSAAISAVMGLAKIHGLVIDKKQVTARVEMANLSDADLADIATGRSPGTSETSKSPEGSDILHEVH